MKKIVLILLLLATIAVASWYFFPEQAGKFTQYVGIKPAGEKELIDVFMPDTPLYTGVVQVPAHMPEQPVAEVEDAVYKDVSEVAGADIFALAPGSSLGRVRREDGVDYPGYIVVSQGRIAVNNDVIVAGAFALDMSSIALEEPNDDILADVVGPEYLDVEQYPEASFVLQDVSSDKVSGILTLKGISKKVTFPALVITSEDKIRIFSDFSIDRTEWGIIDTSPTINIYLDLHIERILTKV